jgi:hypothetical protein
MGSWKTHALLPREAKRSVTLAVRMREQEVGDLRTIAEEWGVPPASVAWALIVDLLAEMRGAAPDHGSSGIATAAAAYLLRRAQAKGGSEGSSAQREELLAAASAP